MSIARPAFASAPTVNIRNSKDDACPKLRPRGTCYPVYEKLDHTNILDNLPESER